MKVLFFGDIDGKIGRNAVAKVLPVWQKKYQPDIIIANADNVTHGRGMNRKHFDFLSDLGVDIFTAGDHTLERKEAEELLNTSDIKVLRPYNLEGDYVGRGEAIFSIRKKRLLMISLLGRVFMDEPTFNPFQAIDSILEKYSADDYDLVIVDLHAEATSEKHAFAWYVDGRVNAVFGTHTHVQTADERILPKGTAAISDVGFCGASDSVIGVDKKEIINHFLTGKNFVLKIPEHGAAQVNAVFVEFNKNKKAKNIKRLQEKVIIKK